MIILRPYQQEAKDALRDYEMSGGKRALVVAATGTGKRIFAVDISAKYKKVLFIAHREELIEQAYADYEKYFPFDVGIVKGPRNELNKRITVASVQTLWRRIQDIPNRLFDLVIVDEAHTFISRTFSKTVMHFDCDMLVGLTATPTRLDGLSMTNLFEKIVHEYPIEKAVKEGYLCEINAMRVKTEVDLSKVHTRMGDLSTDELSRTVDIPERNNLIVDKYIQYANEKQALAFGVDIKHANNLMYTFLQRGIKAACVHSNLSTEERKDIIRSFRNGETTVLTNCEILTTGFDYSDIGCLLMARPTKSLSLYLQMVGRGTRLKSENFISRFEKNQVTVLDFVDNVGKHTLINCWNIEQGKSVEDRVFISKERRDAFIAKKEEETKKRNAKLDKLYKHDKKLNLLELPVVNQSAGAWKRLPPTENQIIFIKHLGLYDEDVDYTRGQISELISNLPATEAQIKALAKFKYDVTNGCTRGQAELAFKELSEKGMVTKREPITPVKPPFTFFN